MKNHIKNYIKIMGLAAVPFGTAQVHGEGGRILIKVEKYVLREGVYGIDIKVQQFCDGKLMHKSVIEYWWDEVSFKLKRSSDIFPKNNEGSSFRDRGKSVEGTGFLHGVIPGIIRDGTHIASFNAMDYSERDVSKRWLFTGYLFWFVRTFKDVMLVLCTSDDENHLGIVSDVPVVFLESCRNIPDNTFCGYGKIFRFADAESLVRGCSRPACLKIIPASLERYLLGELYFGTKEDYEKERRRLEEEMKKRREEAKRREEKMKKRRHSFYEEEEEDDEEYVEIKEKLEPKPTPTQARIKALFEADGARRENLKKKGCGEKKR